ncbi:uncharacterized protein K489DRAFT_403281 [Dissoconium aciculare CBS 342.82]|uniref:Uncharacterized protein n=1 Tax=Dissoconium aciculare CBS 342.82 TaxID=1314786 RepID=A0A6J3LYF9_9PEZI|nr:uncharacterized protein K489DRAFT_403281 [Dissoconium aciculare CBS 342.82]KAF1820683.1 hypothetical protein K489DRAFT_403281 [Dissoconium aciculare CBS 342.82]
MVIDIRPNLGPQAISTKTSKPLNKTQSIITNHSFLTIAFTDGINSTPDFPAIASNHPNNFHAPWTSTIFAAVVNPRTSTPRFGCGLTSSTFWRCFLKARSLPFSLPFCRLGRSIFFERKKHKISLHASSIHQGNPRNSAPQRARLVKGKKRLTVPNKPRKTPRPRPPEESRAEGREWYAEGQYARGEERRLP